MLNKENLILPKSGGGTSFPLRQNLINTGLTKSIMGMPQKFRYEDGSNQFSQGRKIFLKTPLCSSNIIGLNLTSIRVDSNIPNCNKNLANNKWSSSRIQTSMRAIHSNKNLQCIKNGKKSEVVSSDQYLNKIKNKAIGSGSTNSDQKDYSFKSNNKTNLNTTNQSLKKVRSGGCVAPAKKGAIENKFKSGSSGFRAVYGGGNKNLEINFDKLNNKNTDLQSEFIKWKMNE